jgi:Ran GTPase-activating protein (RanGAP) involved in mRNA processing and transport
MSGSFFEYNSTLTEIRLGGNNLADQGVIALSRDYGLNCIRCRNLSCQWNQISDDGSEALAGALRENGTLGMMDLSGNQIGERGKTALAQSCIVSCGTERIEHEQQSHD